MTLNIPNDEADWNFKNNLPWNIELVPHGTLDTTLELSGEQSG
jgi:hypothetical protein